MSDAVMKLKSVDECYRILEEIKTNRVSMLGTELFMTPSNHCMAISRCIVDLAGKDVIIVDRKTFGGFPVYKCKPSPESKVEAWLYEGLFDKPEAVKLNDIEWELSDADGEPADIE